MLKIGSTLALRERDEQLNRAAIEPVPEEGCGRKSFSSKGFELLDNKQNTQINDELVIISNC
jgi:hypothetical protein